MVLLLRVISCALLVAAVAGCKGSSKGKAAPSTDASTDAGADAADACADAADACAQASCAGSCPENTYPGEPCDAAACVECLTTYGPACLNDPELPCYCVGGAWSCQSFDCPPIDGSAPQDSSAEGDGPCDAECGEGSAPDAGGRDAGAE